MDRHYLASFGVFGSIEPKERLIRTCLAVPSVELQSLKPFGDEEIYGSLVPVVPCWFMTGQRLTVAWLCPFLFEDPTGCKVTRVELDFGRVCIALFQAILPQVLVDAFPEEVLYRLPGEAAIS